MNDVLIIFDNCGELLYTNKKGKELAHLNKSNVSLNDIEKYCQDHIDRFNNSLLTITYNDQILYFDIETNEIKDYKKRLQASVYLFYDVTLRETEKGLEHMKHHMMMSLEYIIEDIFLNKLLKFIIHIRINMIF